MNNFVIALSIITVAMVGFAIGIVVSGVQPSNLICAQPHLKDGKAICAVYVNKDAVK